MTYLLTKWCLGSTDQELGRFSYWYFFPDLLLISGTVGSWLLYGCTPHAVALAVLILSAVVISITDFRFQVIPDRLTLPCTAVGLLIATISNHVALLDALIGGIVGFLLFYLLAVVADRAFRKESMGGGDIKLAAMLGAFLGWQQLLLAIFLAAWLALIFVLARRLIVSTSFRAKVPFGPFLLYASLIAFVLGSRLTNAYLEVVGLSGIR